MGDGEKGKRGFASMDKAKQREIAAMGGRASHKLGRGHEWTRESASAAGRKGGKASHEARRKREAAAAPVVNDIAAQTYNGPYRTGTP